MKAKSLCLNVLLYVTISCIFFILFSCNKSQKIEAKESNQRKPYLLYFNERDTMTYKVRGGLFALKYEQDTFKVYPYYWKSDEKFSKRGLAFNVGKDHSYKQRKIV